MRQTTTRYPLANEKPWFNAVVAAFLIGGALYTPLAQWWRTGAVDWLDLLLLIIVVPIIVLIWWRTDTYVELTDDAVLVRGFITRRIPLAAIEHVELPRTWERVEWTQLIAGSAQPRKSLTVETDRRNWRVANEADLVVLHVRKERIAIQFADPPTFYADLMRRLQAVPEIE